MSVIVAAHDGPGEYALATDTYSVVNGLRVPSVKSASFNGGTWLVGWAGASVEGAALAEHLQGLEPRELADIEGALRAAYGHARSTVPRHPDVLGIDAHLLLVGPPGIVVLGSDGHVCWAPSRWAIGCGERVALGYVHGREGTPVELVYGAVCAATHLVEGCFGPPRVHSFSTTEYTCPTT